MRAGGGVEGNIAAIEWTAMIAGTAGMIGAKTAIVISNLHEGPALILILELPRLNEGSDTSAFGQ